MVILFLLAILTGYNYFFQPFTNLNPSSVEVEVTPPPSPTPELSAAEKILQQLTPEQKVAQVLALPLTVTDLNDSSSSASISLEFIHQFNPGTITLFGNSISTASAETVTAAIDQLTEQELITPLIAVDHEGGTVQRLRGTGYTRLLSWQQLCLLDSAERQSLLETSAQELKASGIDIVFAPVLDYGVNSVLGSRICSDNPDEALASTKQYISIFRQNSILPVVKHFPGIGKTTQDLHTQFDRVLITDQDAQLYLDILDAFSNIGVMVTHVGVENQYQDIPCSLSKVCVDQITKQYPQVIVFSDALEMKSAAYNPTGEDPKEIYQIAKEAIQAGDEVLVFGEKITSVQLEGMIVYLANTYKTDSTFAQQVDQAVLKLIDYKQQH